jgi:hypothetical protein
VAVQFTPEFCNKGKVCTAQTCLLGNGCACVHAHAAAAAMPPIAVVAAAEPEAAPAGADAAGVAASTVIAGSAVRALLSTPCNNAELPTLPRNARWSSANSCDQCGGTTGVGVLCEAMCLPGFTASGYFIYSCQGQGVLGWMSNTGEESEVLTCTGTLS